MGGSKDSEPGQATKSTLPRTQSMSNARKTVEIQRQLERDISCTPDPECPLLYFPVMAMFMVLVPPLDLHVRRVKEKIMQVLFDITVWKKLEDARVINWCASVKKLYPLWTRGDGNCLPHAVSLYLWGVHDEKLFLRGLIHETLTDAATAGHFRSRWQYARRYLNSTIPEGGLQYDSQEWDREWTMVVDLVSSLRQDADPNNLPYHSLEEIHIFVLANLIRRPIIILSEGVIRRMDGSSLAPNNIGGMYLPTLCNARDCVKSPVVICYDSNHFMPLVGIEEADPGSPSCEHAVPIVTNDLENLPVHFLSESEELQVPQLLEKYLNLIELRWTKTAQVYEVLSIAIRPKKLPAHWNLMEDFCAAIVDDMTKPQGRGLDHEEAQNTASKDQDVLPHEEQNPPKHRVGGSFSPNPGRFEVGSDLDPRTVHETDVASGTERVQSLSTEVQRLAAMESQPCITPGCEFHGLPENGGRCSVCVKEYIKGTACSQTEQTQLKLAECSNIETTTACRDSLRRTASCRENSSRPRQAEKPRSIDHSTCLQDGCYILTSRATHPYCSMHQPYDAIISTVKENSSQPRQAEKPRSIDHSTCLEDGCDFLSSPSTYPYCIIHQPRGAIISMVREDKKHNSGSISAYYARHVTPESSPEPRCESHSLESVQREFPKMCLIGGCTKYGDPKQRNMCTSHNEVYTSQSDKKQRSKKIFPEPATNKKGREARLHVEQVLCQNLRCAEFGEEAFQGYCQECYKVMGNQDVMQNQQNEKRLNLMETFGHKPTDRPKSWAPNGGDGAGIGLNDVAQKNDYTCNTVKSSPTTPTKPSNLNPTDHLPQQRTKRTHPPSTEYSSRQQELPLEKSRRTYDHTLPQFSRYREPQVETVIRPKPPPCQGEGCYSVQLRDNPRGLCLRCETKKQQPIHMLISVSQRHGYTSTSSPSSRSYPLISHSSSSYGLSENDPSAKATSRSRSPNVVNTSYEREVQSGVPCTFAACNNPGLETTNGLCQVCFDLLANMRHLTKKTRPPKASLSTSVTMPSPLHNIESGPQSYCRTSGCEMYGTPETDGLCSQCHAKKTSEYLQERQRDYGRWHYSAPQIGVNTDIRPPSPCSPEPRSPSITADPCQEPRCTKFGDPAFNGFCSQCYTKGGYRANGYDTPDIPVSYQPPPDPVFPPISSARVRREPSYSDGLCVTPVRGTSHIIAKCKNHLVTGCSNYGNVDCREYCNSCYVHMRSSLH